MVLGAILTLASTLTDSIYWAKWAVTYAALRLKKMSQRRRFDLYNFEVEDDPQKIGVLIPEEEKVLESPFSEEHLQEAADEIFLYGVNSKSECLMVRISRACEEEAEAWIYLKLADGRRYELQKTTGYQRSSGGNQCTTFSCDGLQMYYLSPMRRWRIVYCGMLKESRNENDAEMKAVFVKFTFIWSASSEVYDFTSDLEIAATAEAVASVKWSTPIPPIDKLSETFNFYSQSGVINGIVSIEGQPDEELYLFGERTRHIGKSSYLVGCKFKQVLGVVPKSGLIVHLGRASIPNTFHNLPFGFIVHPNGTLYPIEDGFIVSRLSKKVDSGPSLTAMFKAGKQYELTGNFVENVVRFKSERGWSGHLQLRFIEFEVDGLKGNGIMIMGEVTKLPERKVRKVPPVFPAVKPLTVSFTDEICQQSEVSGGKGSSLGRLTKLSKELKSFVVPKGIVVTTAAYDEFLTPETLEKIERLKNVTYGNVEGKMQEACKIVMSTIEKMHLPDRISKEIEEKLSSLYGDQFNHQKFAIRSSATGEDTDQMSAAGQMETFLGIQGLQKIFTAVKKCWASQFSHIAVEYKRQNGQILNSPMAVVIQEMVNCEAAGVLFTCDPVTNNPSVITITGNYGLGETVVSGTEEPDTIVLQKVPGREVEIKSVTIGLKERRIIVPESRDSEEDTGTLTEDVPDEKRMECCISQDVAKRLGVLSLKIEDYYRSPRDIEWGVQDNTIYVLQSRPVTTGAATSDYEIMHEFDGPLRCEGDYFTVCNVGEVMPGATSPLGLDVASKMFGASFQKKNLLVKQRNNFQQNLYFSAGLPPFYNHKMMSVVDLLIGVDDTDSIGSHSMMLGIFGRILDDPDLKIMFKYKNLKPLKPSWRELYMFFWNLFFSGIGLEQIKQKVFSYEFPIKDCKTSLEIFNKLMLDCTKHYDVYEPILKHLTCSEMSSLWNMFMMTTLGNAKGSIDTEVYSDFSKLLSSSSSSSACVESADIPSSLQDLVKWLLKDMKSEDFKAMSVEDAQKWLETSTTLSGYKFRQFIKRHGHRCLKEFDVHSLPWYIDAKPLIKLLQNLSGSSSDTQEKKDGDISKIISELKVPLNFKSRWMLKLILPNCRRGVREREACKSVIIKVLDNTRRGYQHLSKKMVAEGYLPDTDLLYFLTVDEIQNLLLTRNPKLISRANHRRRLFPYLENLMFPEISKGRPVPINLKKEDVEYVADLTMKGIPVSQGVVRGYARVALTLEEASHLKPGEILITYSTDIGWSPYFPILSGVVTEIGGLISHGAVVSREYGLPCVVGLHGATRNFVTGDYVLLDGNKGILQRISGAEE